MVLVSKEEAKWLVSKGAKYKDALHKTIGVASKTYVSEGTKWHKMLMKKRESQIVETYSAK